MTIPTPDPVREFAAALPYSARAALHIDYPIIAILRRAAEQGVDMAELARTVAAGVGKYNPDNARGLMIYRLKREVGMTDDEQEASS